MVLDDMLVGGILFVQMASARLCFRAEENRKAQGNKSLSFFVSALKFSSLIDPIFRLNR